MTKCHFCGSTIVFGGVRAEGHRYCDQQCRETEHKLALQQLIPDDLVAQHAAAVHCGVCPKCGGPGPIDIHTSHYVWSLLYTWWTNKRELCCQRCGRKSKWGGVVFSFFLGWAGIPWGYIMTPVQITRNIRGLLRPPGAARPSPGLLKWVRADLAAKACEASPRSMDDRAQEAQSVAANG
jgi:hypothetical protein